MSDFHKTIAKQLAPLIAELRCDECSLSVVPSEPEIATYLEEGWPSCHGFTMRLVGTERGKLRRCGYCIGIQPGEERARPWWPAGRNGRCPCCGQLALSLYEGDCTARHTAPDVRERGKMGA